MFCILERTLKAIADAIRAKTGKTDMLDPADFATEIDNISGEIPEGYIKPEGRKLIVTNGVHDVAAYEEVNVSVGDNEIETSNNTLKLFLGDTFTYEYNNSIEFVVNPTGLVKCNQSKGVATFNTIGVGSCHMTITERNAAGDAIKINNYYITVEQKAESAKLKEHTATTNGVYLPPNGYDGFSKFTVNVPSEEIPVITYTYDIRLGDTFSINYEEQTSPYVEMSNTKTLSYYDDGGLIEFTAIGVGECTVELQSPNITDDGDYVVIARANIIVRAQDVPEVAPSYVTELKVGDVFYLDYENSSPDVYVSNSSVISYRDDGGTIEFTAIHVGDCIVELRRSRGGDEYDVLAKAIATVLDAENVPVYSYNLKVGEGFSLDYENSSPTVVISNPSLLSYYDDGGLIEFTAIGVGSVTVELKKANGITISKANITITKEEEKPVPTYTTELKVGDMFDLDYENSSPYVVMSNANVLSYKDDGGLIEFTAIGVGECVVELQSPKLTDDGDYVVIARANVTVLDAENIPVYSYNLKVGQGFSLDYEYSSPIVSVSNNKVLSYYDDGGTIEFMAIGVGSATVELKKENGITISKANVTVEEPDEVFDYIVSVGDPIYLDVDPEGDQQIRVVPEGILRAYNDGGTWEVNAIGEGTCTIYIGEDMDLHDHVFKVKVVGKSVEEYNGSITIS